MMITRSATAVTLLLIAGAIQASAFEQRQSTTELKIVVIEGEGAVNIIQQKTAVAPVIEVRDRNDQPVAGATVNFVVRAGRATFSGARTMSVTTNAAGRAAAAGFAPSGTGALQIGATATFQGQTAAAVTIAQTNVMTAAEAAAASSATASGAGSGGGGTAAGGGGAGAGGGGISATTLGIVGGAVAAGAVVAKDKIFGEGGTLFSGQFSGVLLDTDTAAAGFGNSSCTRNERQTGTLKIRLDSLEGSISGTMSLEGDIVISGGTCQPDPSLQNTDKFVLSEGSVSGSPDNISGTGHEQNDYTNPTVGGGGINAYDYTFTGRLEGDQITGSLTVVRSITWRKNDNSYASTSHGTVTHQITLRK